MGKRDAEYYLNSVKKKKRRVSGKGRKKGVSEGVPGGKAYRRSLPKKNSRVNLEYAPKGIHRKTIPKGRT